AVDTGADEHQITGSRDSTAETWRAGFDSTRFKLFEDAERHTPSNVSGVRIDRNEFSPGRRRTGVLGLRIPESPTFRGDLAEALRRTRRVVAAPSCRSSVVSWISLGTGIVILPRPATTRSSSRVRVYGFHMTPLSRIHDIGDDQAQLRVVGNALPVASANRTGKHDDVLMESPRRIRAGILQVVLVPQSETVRREVGRDVGRQIGPRDRISR